jgi:hypothetical protein
MSNETKQGKADHAAIARRFLDHHPDVGPGAPAVLAMAQIHASLAVAEQLERLNETLGGLTSGGTDRYLKVRNG